MARVYADANAELGRSWYDYGEFVPSRLSEYQLIYVALQQRILGSFGVLRSGTNWLIASVEEDIRKSVTKVNSIC